MSAAQRQQDRRRDAPPALAAKDVSGGDGPALTVLYEPDNHRAHIAMDQQNALNFEDL